MKLTVSYPIQHVNIAARESNSTIKGFISLKFSMLVLNDLPVTNTCSRDVCGSHITRVMEEEYTTTYPRNMQFFKF